MLSLLLVLSFEPLTLNYPFRTSGKDGGDQSRPRPLDGQPLGVGPTTAPRGASAEAPRMDPPEGPIREI